MSKEPETMILTAFAVGCMFAFGNATIAGEFQIRPEYALSGPVADELRWSASLEPLLDSDAQQADEIALVGGLNWKPIDHVAITPQFMYVTKGADASSNESRPRIALELDGKAGPLKIAVRNRIEYRMKEGKDDCWRYRGRVKVKFPTIGTVTPFLYDELYYEFGNIDELNKNETGGGVGIPLDDQLGLDVDVHYYRSKRDGEWDSGNVCLRTLLNYAF
jgi:hypothetical protein